MKSDFLKISCLLAAVIKRQVKRSEQVDG